MPFSGRFVLNIIHFAKQQGASFEALVQETGKNEEELCQEDTFVDDTLYYKAMEQAVRMSGDSCFGLHVGENLNLTAAGLIAQLTQTCATVKQALQYCCEFANLGCSALPMTLVEEKEYYKVVLTPSKLWNETSPASLQHTADGVLAFTVKEFQTLTRSKHNPVNLHLPWSSVSSILEYERIFACPVEMGKQEIALFLDKAHVEDHIITANYDLLRILVAHAEEKNATLNEQQGFVSIVRKSIIKMVKPEFPTVEEVASHLNVSVRTLQRKLQEESVSFKSVIEELKKEFALSYLKKKDLSISEVAYLLGYSDSSAFNRSFKRWTGKSPSEYR